MEDICAMCGAIIPEGIQACGICENRILNRKDSNMIETVVNIDTVDKVKEFYNLCLKCTGEVSVCGGRYVVSGKSIMELFTLDLTHPVKVEFDGDIPIEVREGMKKFIVD